MPSASVLSDFPGGNLLLEWFGRAPSFHDAELLQISFAGNGMGRLLIHAWNMMKEVDANGHFVLDKHAIVTLSLEGISEIHLADFDAVPGIIFNLEITKAGEYLKVEWDASYGVTGSIVANHIRFDLVPGKPD